MDQIKIGGFIAEERKRKGYTQKILSEKLGISDKTISKWERGYMFRTLISVTEKHWCRSKQLFLYL